jgi:anti-sigma factor ChrR (cupin superfamily)
MSDETFDDTIELNDPSEYEDLVSQRAIAFCHVAQLADTINDQTVKELCVVMLRKLNSSIKAPSVAELRSLDGGPLGRA